MGGRPYRRRPRALALQGLHVLAPCLTPTCFCSHAHLICCITLPDMSMGCCSTAAMPTAAAPLPPCPAAGSGAPSTSISPRCGRYSPSSSAAMVDLPPPEGPTSATVCSHVRRQSRQDEQAHAFGATWLTLSQRQASRRNSRVAYDISVLARTHLAGKERNVQAPHRPVGGTRVLEPHVSELHSLLLACGCAAAGPAAASELAEVPPPLPPLLLLLPRGASWPLLPPPLLLFAASAGATSPATRSRAPTALPSSPREAAAEDRPTEMNRFSTFTAPGQPGSSGTSSNKPKTARSARAAVAAGNSLVREAAVPASAPARVLHCTTPLHPTASHALQIVLPHLPAAPPR